MKTYLITTVLALVCAISHAQVDSTNNGSSKMKNTTQQSQATPQVEKSFSTKNMVKVKTTSVPAGLRKTLEEVTYLGWEKGNLYFDKKTKEYALLLPTESPEEANMKFNKDINAKKTPAHTGWYFFTQEGQPISN